MKIDAPAVVHEEIDGEVVIVNLDKGLYFSTDGVGATVWTMIAAGHSVDEIHQWGREAFSAENGVESDVTAFLTDLRENQLVSETAEAPVNGQAAVAEPPSAYVKPTLQVYADMQELLLLDPIHEVDDDAGWPHAPA